MVAGDNPAPAINALIHGHFSEFVAGQPLMGLVSILLRAPFAAMAAVFGGGNRLAYALGAVACVTPAGLLVFWFVRSRRAAGGWLAAAVAGVLLLASPAALSAIRAGHPEETLAAVLATAAVLAAIRGRAGWAAVLLGTAVGTKQWALIAALPVLTALPGRRVRAAAITVILAAVLTAALPLADLSAFARADHAVGAGHTANTASAWWPVSSPIPTPAHAALEPTARRLPLGLTRSGASLIVLFVCLGASLLAIARLRARRHAADALALLALLALMRCVGDPGDLHYYFLAVLVPLATWEIVSLGRVPIVAVVAACAAALTFGVGLPLAPGQLDGFAIAWTLALAGYLTRGAFRAPTPRSAAGLA